MSVHTTTARYLGNLRAVVANASQLDIEDGMSWYADAQNFAHTLAQTLDPNVWGTTVQRRARAAGVIAVLSPRQSWAKNKLYAARCVEYARQGIPELMLELPVFRTNAIKAMGVLSPAAPMDVVDLFIRGPKVRAFYNNIMGDQSTITLDTHAINACRNEFAPAPALPKAPEREAMALAYTLLADEMGCTPAQAQAVVWVTWRHLKNPAHTHG